jgi:N-methylhydantoinase B
LRAHQGPALEPGDRLIFRTAGGGGWGDPRLRDRAAVTADVARGLVSPEAAQRDYGFEAAQDDAAE